MLTDSTPAKILIVEDESIVALDLQNSLLRLNYEVPQILESGEAAILAAQSSHPDLILMDIRLKGDMDGIEAAEVIRKTLDIPIIFLTAFADQATLERAKKIDPIGYLLKPFDEQELYVTIEIALHKHHSEQEVKEQTNWLKTVLQSIGDAVITTDLSGSITFMNRVAEGLTEWAQSEAIGHDISDVLTIANQITQKTISNPIHQALKDGGRYGLPENTILVTKNDVEIPIDDSAVPILDAQNNIKGGVIVFRDITERVRTDAQLYQRAFVDDLTQLPNRAAFIQLLNQAFKRIQQHPNDAFTLFFIDLDQFKRVNDCLGHGVGDRLLMAAAQRLQHCLRPTDTVARLGGDEFSILCERSTNFSVVCRIAERIIAAFQQPFMLDGKDLICSTSIGIVQSHQRYQTADEMLRDADIAMYRAKAKGRGCYTVFDTQMYHQVSQLLQLETDLRQAIANHDLTVYYQPILELKTQKIKGFEALVRWNHPEQGQIGPTVFIPIAAETNLIVPLDWWVLAEACRQLRQWQTQWPAYEHLTISVNVSSKQFAQSSIVEYVQQTLDETGLPARCLKLELTEHALIKNPEKAIALLCNLRALGVELCIDDFGTGYSSLSYLHQYPLDVLKIDRSFIHSLDEEHSKIEIVQAIIMLAHILGMEVIAEGIETAHQLGAMKALNCEYGQGYLFYHPLSAPEAEALLQAKS